MSSESDDSDQYVDANDEFELDVLGFDDSSTKEASYEDPKDHLEVCLENTVTAWNAEEEPEERTEDEKHLKQQDTDGDGNTSTTLSGQMSIVSTQPEQQIVAPWSEQSVELIYSRLQDMGKPMNLTLQHTVINNPSAVSFGGQVTVQPEPTDEKPPQSEGQFKKRTQRNHTETDIEEMTRGMVETEATKRLCKLIDQGRKWLLITGCPGDGKTVAAYLVLKYLFDLGKEVFIIRTPEEYLKSRRKKNAVFLLEDILEKDVFSECMLEIWAKVLGDLKALSQGESRNSNIILMTQRLNVWKSASPHIAEYQQYIRMVNVSKIERSRDEKLLIWKYHVSEYKVEMESRIVENICQRTDLLPYGFPSLCRMFVQLRKKLFLDMLAFFLKPVEFLVEAMERLLTRDSVKSIFKELLLNDGRMSLDQVEERFRADARDLNETFLSIKRTTESAEVEFIHDSVYDGAAFIIAKKEDQFVVDNCRMQFLKERIKFTEAEDCESTHVSHVYVHPSPRIIESYLKRSVYEILKKGNIELVLSHDVFMEWKPAITLMEKLVSEEGLDTILKKKDRKSGKSFLFLATSSGTEHMLLYIFQQQQNLSSAEQQEALFGICQHDAVVALRSFIRKYPKFDLSVTNSEQQTPFMIAVRSRSIKSQNELSSHIGANIATQTDSFGKSALHHLSEFGGIPDKVKSLILAGGNVNLLCSNQMSPLHYAAKNGHCEIAAELVHYGADVNISTSQCTPLYGACTEGHTDMIKLLVDNKANMDEKCVMSACSAGHADAVRTLLQEGAVIDKSKLLNDACRTGRTGMVRTLVECQTDVNAMFEGDHRFFCHYFSRQRQQYLEVPQFRNITSPPLFTAYLFGHSEVVKLLIELGADVNKKASDDCAVFSIAKDTPSEDSIAHLINGGLDVNLAGGDGNTILHIACEEILQTTVKTIIEKDADVNKSNRNGDTSLHIACITRWGYAQKEEDYNEHPYKALFKIVEMLVEGGGNVNRPGSQGNTPLHRACKHKLGHLVRFLLEKGANFSLKNDAGETALRSLCYGNIESEVILHIAEEMIQKGANEDDLDGWFKSEYKRRQALFKLQAMEGN